MDEKPLKNSIAKNSLFNIIYNVSNIVFPFVISIYVSRILLPEGVGQVSYAQNIASYFVAFAAMGIPTLGIREIAKAENDKKNKVFTELFLINSATTICATIIYLLLIFLIPSFRNDILLFLCFGLQVFMNLINIDWLYQGNEDYAYIAKRNLFIKIISLVAIFIFVKTRNDYIIYALISVLALTLNNIFNIIHSRVYVKFNFHNIEIKKYLKPLLFLGLCIFMSNLYCKVDITMLGSMKDQSSVGLYSNAHSIVEALTTLCVAIYEVFLPRLSFYYKESKEKFYELIYYGIEILSFIAIPMMVGVFLLAPEAIFIMYGDAFSMASTTLRIFSPLIIIRSFGGLLCYQLIIATGNEKKRLPAYFATAISNVILNYFLIPVLSQNGAAIASIFSELLLNGMQLIVIVRMLHLRIKLKPIVQAILSSAGMLLVIILVKKCINVVYIRTIVSVAAGLLIYFVINFLIKNALLMRMLNRFKSNISNTR